MKRLPVALSLALSVLAVAACGQHSDSAAPVAAAPAATAVTPVADTEQAPADAFFARLTALCGQAFAGKLVAYDDSDLAAFAGAAVMHVRDCDARQIRIPFHVGDDHSRTWIITRTADGLRLKHDHRHADGSADAVTMYGGDTVAPGSAGRQQFPVDADSRALFERNGMRVSMDNTWAVEVEPGATFAYELTRPNRHFRVEFDLRTAVAAPPPPWGADVSIE